MSLSADEARLLDVLTLGGGGVAAVPGAAGVRRARTRGAGIEFHDFRPYQIGDDPRAIDWTVEARLHQLVVRVARADGHVRMHVLVDASASMAIGNPTKAACAARVAAALSYLAIEGRHAAGASAFRDRLTTYLPPAEGRVQLHRIFQTLQQLTPAGRSSIDVALEQYAGTCAGPGLVPVLSDYFENGAGIRGLQRLVHRGLTPAVVQVLAPEEISPELGTAVELFDVEDETAPPLVAHRDVVAAYQRRLAAHETALREFCIANRCPWVRIRTDMSFRDVLAALNASGIISATA